MVKYESKGGGSVRITEKRMIEELNGFISSCDTDSLCYLIGDLFGGKCDWLSDDIYEFTPLKGKYCDAFGKVKDEELVDEKELSEDWLNKLADRIKPELSQEN